MHPTHSSMMAILRSLHLCYVCAAAIANAAAAAAAFLPSRQAQRAIAAPPATRGWKASPQISRHPHAASLLVSAALPNPGSSAESPRDLVQKGMKSFRDGDVQSSLTYFDRANAAVLDGSLTPYLWQRGITYYYLDQFREGSDQFRLDVSVNPLDVEEIVWDIACLARDGSKLPEKDRMMELPNGKKDRRKIMSTVYSLFRGDGATELDLRQAGHDGNIADEFYSLFYLGLYCEAKNEKTKAEEYMKAAASSKYAMGPGTGDYMTSCAKVHCKLRGWV